MSNKRKILVVDDDPGCLEFAKAVLSPRYDVRTVLSVGQFRSEVQAEKPDLIMLDVMMSHLSDGLDLTRELKESDSTRDIPVIMLTGVTEVYDYRTQTDSSFFPHDCWLDKPVTPEDLIKAVGKILDGSDGK